jgi:hypothetical protein
MNSLTSIPNDMLRLIISFVPSEYMLSVILICKLFFSESVVALYKNNYHYPGAIANWKRMSYKMFNLCVERGITFIDAYYLHSVFNKTICISKDIRIASSRDCVLKCKRAELEGCAVFEVLATQAEIRPHCRNITVVCNYADISLNCEDINCTSPHGRIQLPCNNDVEQIMTDLNIVLIHQSILRFVARSGGAIYEW